jgi:hypothetical protein
MNYIRTSTCVWLICAFAVMTSASRAAIIEWFTEDLDAFDAFQDLGDGVNPYGVQIVPEGSSPFSDGNAMRMIDFYDEDKPELQGELSAPLFEPFRIDFQSFNQSPASSSSAIRFRMGNSGQSITSESRVAFSLSWQADKRFTAKYNGSSDGNPNDIDTTNSTALTNVADITMVANGALAGTYTYNLFGLTRTLNPLSYDIYIDGQLFNDSSPGDAKHDEFKNGMLFHSNASASYNPALGLQRFGLVGSSDANVDPDVLYDNIILRTGANIPEPASLVLAFAGGAMLWFARRKR